MKQNVNESIFRDTMRRLRPNNFTWGNLSHLYSYLVEMEDDCGTEVDFDPIGFCCEFTEYKNLEEFQEAYGNEYQTYEDIQDATIFIQGDDDSFIIGEF